DGVIEQLVEECDVPPHLIGHLAFVAPMFVGARDGRRIRRISELAVLEPLGPAYDRHSIARWRPADDAFEILTTPAEIDAAARRLGMEHEELLHEVSRRASFLETLIAEHVFDIEGVQRRIFEFAGYE